MQVKPQRVRNTFLNSERGFFSSPKKQSQQTQAARRPRFPLQLEVPFISAMGEHVVLTVDRLMTPESSPLLQKDDLGVVSGESSCSHSGEASCAAASINIDEEQVGDSEEEPLLQTLECRICQEEDILKNLETPCACNGSLKFAHRSCVQRWCDEKGDINCEICHQPYQPGYTAPSPNTEDTSIDIGGSWTLSSTPLNLHDPRILAVAAAEHRLLEVEYDDYADSSASGASFCRSAALILMALLLMRHALAIGNGDGDDDDDASTFFSVFLLRVAGFLLPCYIMAWAISVLQRRRQRQEAAALAAAEVAFMLQAGQSRGLHVSITPAPAATPEQPPTRSESV